MISDSGEIIPGASDLGNLSPLQSQGSLFNPLGLDLLDESAAPGRSREACTLRQRGNSQPRAVVHPQARAIQESMGKLYTSTCM